MFSLNLTIHNKDFLIEHVLDGIYKNTSGSYELIIVLDGCQDNSEAIVKSFLKNKNIKYKLLYQENVFETKANNIAAKNSEEDYIIIIQDDMIIQEKNWNIRMIQPIKKFDDVFGVTSRTAHNWVLNEYSQDINLENFNLNRWADILIHTDHADRNSIDRNTFAVRNSANRGPLLLKHEILKKLNYFDEIYAPQDMDEHDLFYRAREHGYKCGCYWIDFLSDPDWGGTRKNGETSQWMLNANFKNSKIFVNRYKNLLKNESRLIENRAI